MNLVIYTSFYLLCCLSGSQRVDGESEKTYTFSKLPMRQSTTNGVYPKFFVFSKLPMRQSTVVQRGGNCWRFSKLPMRQSTSPFHWYLSTHFSKLPMRQSTAEESEKSSAPSRKTFSPSILPKASTERKKSR